VDIETLGFTQVQEKSGISLEAEVLPDGT